MSRWMLVLMTGAAAAGLACNGSKNGAGGGDAGGGGAGGGGFPSGASCDEEPDPHCTHPVDRVVVPALRGVHAPIRDAARGELCRRMAIDLVGRIPTPAELDRCVAGDAGAAADLFMALPEYGRTQRRALAELLSYDGYLMWYGNVADLDAEAGRLFDAKTPLRWDDFAAIVATHPGFYARHQGDDWAAALFAAFLGRTPRPDEIAGLRPLVRGWTIRQFCDGATRFNAQTLGLPADTVKTLCGLSFEWAWNPCACLDGYGSVGCRSTAAGMPLDFGVEACDAPDFRLMRRVAAHRYPGQRATMCPDGTTGCYDRDLLDRPLEALAPISDAQRAAFAAMGRVLGARGDFWEALVDRELRRFLGWWQSGFRRPDFDLPAVRAVLADEVRKAGTLRPLHRLIVTSLLYGQPADAPVGADGKLLPDPPPFAMGPTKLLAAESWLDSAGVAVGETLGVCDFRFVSRIGFFRLFVDQSLIEKVPSSLGAAFPPDRYETAAQTLGGCTAGEPRPTVSSIGVVMAQRRNAEALCAIGSAVIAPGTKATDGSDGALDAETRYLWKRFLARDATDAEVTEARADMRACLAEGAAKGRDAGCISAEEAKRWLCQRLIDSAEFSLY